VTVFLMVLQLLIGIALTIVVVLQKSKGEGLGSIGGGAQMFFDQARGLDKVLDRATVYLATAFILISIVISIWG